MHLHLTKIRGDGTGSLGPYVQIRQLASSLPLLQKDVLFLLNVKLGPLCLFPTVSWECTSVLHLTSDVPQPGTLQKVEALQQAMP